MNNHDWILDESIVPMHHHSGDDAKDFLLDVSGKRPEVVTAAEASHRARARGVISPVREAEGVSRRTLLKGSGGTLGLASLMAVGTQPRMAFAAGGAPGGKDTLVCIFLRGGFDGLSALVPIGDPAYLAARPKIAITPEKGLIPMDGFWGAHPQMASLQPMFSAGDLAVVAATGNPDPTRSHFDGQASMERCAGWEAKAASVSSGWLGRYLAASSSTQGTFRALTVGDKAVAALSASFPTLAFTSLMDFDLNAWEGHKASHKKALATMYRQAGGLSREAAEKTLGAIDGLADVRAQPSTPANGAVYPATRFGDNLKDVARMIKSGKGLEVACVDLGDWDMHANLGQATDPGSWFARKIREFSDALAAFRLDLGSFWSTTTVVTMSEFGRRVQENGGGGVDHGHGNLMFLAGGGVNGGRIYGTWPSLSPGSLDAGDLAITTDYRTVLRELVERRMKPVDLATVFPNYTPVAPLGIFAS